MRKNPFLIGGILVGIGVLLRFLPLVANFLSALSALAIVAGFLVLLSGVVRRHKRVRAWIKRSPVGRHMLVVGAIVLVIAGALVFHVVRSEIADWVHAGPIKKDLAREEPEAAFELVAHLTKEGRRHGSRGSAILRKRMVVRLGELGNAERRITTTLRDVLTGDPSGSVKEAAAEALALLMTPAEMLDVIRKLPELDEDARRYHVLALERKTGQFLGGDAEAWGSWYVTKYAEGGGANAVKTAVETYRSYPENEEIRVRSLGRIRAAKDLERGEAMDLLRDEDPALRAAAAVAAKNSGDASWAKGLGDVLNVEAEDPAAEALVKALVALDPDAAPLLLFRVVKTSRKDAARLAATDWLAKLAGGKRELAELAAAVHDKLPRGTDRRGVLTDLIGMAKESAAARGFLLEVVRDAGEETLSRNRALRGALEADPELLMNRELVELMDGGPDPDFAEAVRAVLRDRTGRDGQRDPEVWRKILDQLD